MVFWGEFPQLGRSHDQYLLLYYGMSDSSNTASETEREKILFSKSFTLVGLCHSSAKSRWCFGNSMEEYVIVKIVLLFAFMKSLRWLFISTAPCTHHDNSFSRPPMLMRHQFYSTSCSHHHILTEENIMLMFWRGKFQGSFLVRNK